MWIIELITSSESNTAENIKYKKQYYCFTHELVITELNDFRYAVTLYTKSAMINNHPIESTSNIQFDYAGVQNEWNEWREKNRLDSASAKRPEEETTKSPL